MKVAVAPFLSVTEFTWEYYKPAPSRVVMTVYFFIEYNKEKKRIPNRKFKSIMATVHDPTNVRYLLVHVVLDVEDE